jgi:hypothetical protein
MLIVLGVVTIGVCDVSCVTLRSSVGQRTERQPNADSTALCRLAGAVAQHNWTAVRWVCMLTQLQLLVAVAVLCARLQR